MVANHRSLKLGIAEGASENQVVAKGLLENLVARGLDPQRRYLFVIGLLARFRPVGASVRSSAACGQR